MTILTRRHRFVALAAYSRGEPVRGVVIATGLLPQMRREAREAYPHECCGFLLSPAESKVHEVRRIVTVAAAENRSPASRRDRFAILPEDLAAAERAAERSGLIVSGFYHSHPDRPARPSESDQVNAWPWYVYLIVSSSPRGFHGEVGAFELHPERRELVPVRWVSAPAPIGPSEPPSAVPSFARKAPW